MLAAAVMSTGFILATVKGQYKILDRLQLCGTEMPTPKVPDNQESTHSETLATGTHRLSSPGKGELTSFCLLSLSILPPPSFC